MLLAMNTSFRTFLLAAILIINLGCESTLNDSKEDKPMYDQVFFIPVKKPSSYGEEFIAQKALEMGKKYGVTNMVTAGAEVSDERWKNDYTIEFRLENLNWDYASKSMMKISYRRVHGLGVKKFKGKIQLLVDGKEYGWTVLSENGNLKGYLQEMEKLGIYIPFL